MYKDLLPIGSVVLLKGGEKRLMICGRVVCREEGEQLSCFFSTTMQLKHCFS